MPKISFWIPLGIDLMDSNSSCEIKLMEGTESITIKIKATCKYGGVEGGLMAIVPRIIHQNSKLWHHTAHLPTVWVCIILPLIDKIIYIVLQVSAKR